MINYCRDTKDELILLLLSIKNKNKYNDILYQSELQYFSSFAVVPRFKSYLVWEKKIASFIMELADGLFSSDELKFLNCFKGLGG